MVLATGAAAAAQLTFNSCPTVDRAVKDVMQCLPLAEFPLSNKSPNSRSTSFRFWRCRDKRYESVEVWVSMRRA